MDRPARIACSAALVLVAGCGGGGSPDAGAPVLPYYSQVQALVQQHCQSCHVTGGFAPFPLETYEDARSHAAAIATAVSSRRMPPWKPADGCRPLEASRRLTDADAATLVAWANGGTPQG